MKIKFIFLLPLLILCSSCSDVGKALRNEKIRTTDEFLIEKRGPLSLPPKMGELPKPNSSGEVKKKNKNVLDTVSGDIKTDEKSELENIFLEEIKKN
tara:strand:+ start:206 stop:496 length:291 start_codon:yes stop_codon:yes gene_type:complete